MDRYLEITSKIKVLLLRQAILLQAGQREEAEALRQQIAEARAELSREKHFI